ncbi:hypothetical protein J437_LFUL007744 [Ladona fulva]|uniref:Uncharacterized protein n=1 Tax=Ladona fulva TaxID=123851 RepID=A0A8K0KGT9_LADFU|nr:hypothetical protein J437_LFUL007744 [Ladona fulva]
MSLVLKTIIGFLDVVLGRIIHLYGLCQHIFRESAHQSNVTYDLASNMYLQVKKNLFEVLKAMKDDPD